MKFFNGLLSRAPFTILGMIGLFSIVGNFMTLEENIYQTLEAWRSVTRPIWEFLLGWLFEWIGWEMPWWVKDYLTMGAIVAGAQGRGAKIDPDWQDTWLFRSGTLIVLALMIPVWPLIFVSLFWSFKAMLRSARAIRLSELADVEVDPELTASNDRLKQRNMIFFETFIFAFILIAINYAFVFSGAPSVPPTLQIWV